MTEEMVELKAEIASLADHLRAAKQHWLEAQAEATRLQQQIVDIRAVLQADLKIASERVLTLELENQRLQQYTQHTVDCLRGRCAECGGWPMVSTRESYEREKKNLPPLVRHSNDHHHAFRFSRCTCGLDASPSPVK